MAQQTKGNLSVLYGAVEINGITEEGISYDIGDTGDTVGTIDGVVHIQRHTNSVVSTVTINVAKNTDGFGDFITLKATQIPQTLVIHDSGTNQVVVFTSANVTNMGIGDTTGTPDLEAYVITLKGNLSLVSVE